MAAPARNPRHRRSEEPHGGDDGEPRHQKHALVDAAQDLRGRQHANRHVPAPVRHGAMPRQDRERNPERELELQVIEVFEPVRRERKQHSAEHACRRRSRQLAHQHVRTDSAGGKRGNQRQVVDQQRRRDPPSEEAPAQRRAGSSHPSTPACRDAGSRCSRRTDATDRRATGARPTRAATPKSTRRRVRQSCCWGAGSADTC